MTRLTPAADVLARSTRASGIAHLVAPTSPRKRIGSALAFTAVLAGVQLGLVAGHTGADICRLAGTACTPPARVVGGGVLESHAPGAGPKHVSTAHRSSGSSAVTASRSQATTIQTVALRIPAVVQRTNGVAATAAKPAKHHAHTARHTVRKAQAALMTAHKTKHKS